MVSVSSNLKEAFLKQSEKELLASHLYLQASHWFKVRHYSGFAEKFKSEGDEEREHFNKLIDYVTLRHGEVDIRATTLPATNWENEISVFEFFLDFEKKNYESLYSLRAAASEENDFDAENFLDDMVEEQVKAVFEWEGRVKKAKGYANTPGLLWLYDSKMD